MTRARNLRRDMTRAEQRLWLVLKSLPLSQSHFRRQATIGPFFADFACHTLRLVIEIDGGQHGTLERLRNDEQRTRYLKSRGYKVLRFWNNDVLENTDGVMDVIQQAIGSASPHP